MLERRTSNVEDTGFEPDDIEVGCNHFATRPTTILLSRIKKLLYFQNEAFRDSSSPHNLFV